MLFFGIPRCISRDKTQDVAISQTWNVWYHSVSINYGLIFYSLKTDPHIKEAAEANSIGKPIQMPRKFDVTNE